MFQSLSGFQVRCNLMSNGPHLIILQSFNPYRVFKFAATPGCPAGVQRDQTVSIPIGFSSSLQPIISAYTSAIVILFQSLSGFQVRCNSAQLGIRLFETVGFNPYRVFKFAATVVIAALI